MVRMAHNIKIQNKMNTLTNEQVGLQIKQTINKLNKKNEGWLIFPKPKFVK
jgi:hypothetical protein